MRVAPPLPARPVTGEAPLPKLAVRDRFRAGQPVVRELDQVARQLQLLQADPNDQRVVAGHIGVLERAHQQAGGLSAGRGAAVEHLEVIQEQERFLGCGRRERAEAEPRPGDQAVQVVDRGARSLSEKRPSAMSPLLSG